MILRVGQAPQAGRPYTLRAGAYAILPLGRRVLLTRQSGDAPEIQLPGGGIDPGEAPLRALHREVYEETGYRISGARRLGAFRRFVFMPDYDMWAEKLCHVYLARPCLRIGPPPEPLHQVHWMAAGDVADALGNAGDAMFARRILSPRG